jgi:DNA (cytosine-5)-methyltransferase 1
MKHASLFSGIGGFDLAAEWMGWENVFHCEWNPFGQKILKHYWPNSIPYGDICKTDFNIHRGTVDVLTGGFPCQPYSIAGKRLGKEDERHLWPEMLRAIREVAPRFVVGENVRGIINWDAGVVFNEVQSELEAEGYEILPFLLPSAGVGTDHERYRTWFVAYSERNVGTQSILTENNGIKTLRGRNEAVGCKNWFKPEMASFNVATSQEWLDKPSNNFGYDGISERLDTDTISEIEWQRESLKASGNAIVPQVALQIFKAIEQYEKQISLV